MKFKLKLLLADDNFQNYFKIHVKLLLLLEYY